MKEIFAADILIQEDKKPPRWIRMISYKESDDGLFHNRRYVSAPCKILKVVKHKSLGFEAINEGFTEVEKSNEQRNKITGAYE